MKLLLQHKIFIGYFLLMAIIGCMVAIVLHERKSVAEIEQESITIFQTQSNISTTHRHITVLATFGESVMTWTEKDCELYRTRRLKRIHCCKFYVNNAKNLCVRNKWIPSVPCCSTKRNIYCG